MCFSSKHDERILITGGAGFIGLALAWQLRSTQVVLLDSLSHRVDLQTQWAKASGASLVVGDVRDQDVLGRAMDGCTSVIHLASLAGVDRVRRHPQETAKTIVDGTRKLLDVCDRNSTVRKILLVSTSEVYGEYADNNSEDEVGKLPGDDPRWVYAASKLAAEKMALSFGQKSGIEVFVIRPFNVYGPGQLGRGAVETFVRRALESRDLEIFNGGEQVRAWCFITDLLKGILALLIQDVSGPRIFNLGNPKAASSTKDLAKEVIRLSASLSRLVDRDLARAEVVYRVPNIDRAMSVLGFHPEVSLEQGLRRTIDWYRYWLDRGQARAPWEGELGL